MDWRYARQPSRCQVGSRYCLRVSRNGKKGACQEVIFVAYRPHPGEVVVNDGSRLKVVRRRDLFQIPPAG